MNKGKVSIIMPAYNAADRIEKSIRKIEEQTYRNFELIIVDDGSHDKTVSICSRLKEEFENIIILSQPNAGPGKAREKGMSIADGEYIAFVDSDDYIDEHTLEIVIKVFSEDELDIVQFGYLEIDDNNIISSHPMKYEYFSNSIDAFGYFITQKNCTNFLWNKVYKHTLFHRVEWPGIFYSEDYVVLAQLYGRAKKAITIENELYYYVQHSESAVNKPFSIKKLGQIEAGQYVVNYTREHFPRYVPEALYYVATRAARLSEEVMNSELPNKKDIYKNLIKEFKTSYSEMKKILKSQNRRMELDKTTKAYAISPKVARMIKG